MSRNTGFRRVILAGIGRACCAALALGLLSCGPSADDPPTDAEISSAFVAYWNDNSSKWNNYYLEPVHPLVELTGAKKMDGGITSGPAGQEFYSVRLTLSFKVLRDVYLRCDDPNSHPLAPVLWERAIHPVAPGNMQSVDAGSTVSCDFGSVDFSQVKEGWMPVFGAAYLIRR